MAVDGCKPRASGYPLYRHDMNLATHRLDQGTEIVEPVIDLGAVKAGLVDLPCCLVEPPGDVAPGFDQ